MGRGLGILTLDGWAGLERYTVRIVGETPTRFRIEAMERTRLAGSRRWLQVGETALVPKRAVWPMRATRST